MRVAGADANPHFVLAAVIGLGWRGVEKKLDIKIAPGCEGGESSMPTDDNDAEKNNSKQKGGARLAKDLREATQRFMVKGSVAREVFGDDFVDHFGGTREHEVRLFDEAVTDW